MTTRPTRASQKHPGGRRPKAIEDRRTEVVRVRLTPREVDALYRLATRDGQDLGPFVRAQSLSPLIRAKIKGLIQGAPPR